MITPYYEEPGITIYHGDCRDILPYLEPVDLVLTDPPYGIGLNCDYASSRDASRIRRAKQKDKHAWPSKSHPPIHDNKPFNPLPLLQYKKLALFGANNYADKLPSSYSWLVWDKKTERGSNNNFSDCELIYCRGGNFNSVRIFRYMWAGYLRDGEIAEGTLHPTQKPIALIKWILTFFDNVEFVLDPFMGSGTTLRAAKDLGRKAIGIEIEEKYCEIAVRRLKQEVLPLNEKR